LKPRVSAGGREKPTGDFVVDVESEKPTRQLVILDRVPRIAPLSEEHVAAGQVCEKDIGSWSQPRRQSLPLPGAGKFQVRSSILGPDVSCSGPLFLPGNCPRFVAAKSAWDWRSGRGTPPRSPSLYFKLAGHDDAHHMVVHQPGLRTGRRHQTGRRHLVNLSRDASGILV